MRLYLRGAEQRFATAQNNVGYMYGQGRGTPQNYGEAFKWHLKAAEQGLAEAQNVVAQLCVSGLPGIEFSPRDADKWLRKAHAQGNDEQHDALLRLEFGSLYVENASAEALALFRGAAERGDPFAQTALGMTYQQGRGVPRDFGEAMKWYKKAAAQYHAPAQNSIGWFYDNGLGVKRDDAEALKWYRLSASQGSSSAMVNVGQAYQTGRGVQRDYPEALRWYQKAAEAEFVDTNAYKNLGGVYERGLGVKQDTVQALTWYTLAAERGDGEGQMLAHQLSSHLTPDQVSEARRRAGAWKLQHGLP